jgi:hypothetical protein
MPYIKQALRDNLDVEIQEVIDKIEEMDVESKNGIVVYALYKIVKELYWHSFDEISDGIKVLECAKLEFYRKVLAPYEDIAIDRNGDIE